MMCKIFVLAILAVSNIFVASAFSAGSFHSISHTSSLNLKHQLILKSKINSEVDSSAEEIVSLSRRDSLKKGSSAVLAACLALTVTGDAALADIYDDQEKARKLKQKEDSANSKKLVPLVLFGGSALSIPFFLPNLIRLGKKLGSGGKDDGYGN
uniref:Uncharacterized protein n=1 Tax=Proboscia inermis TaxID=420281 RepID=A0A7S0GCP1_9STRA|mmetsp:Transcript_10035/g.11521  ORF Transcript_10035/g.11521 Transcript_10035/m.11521 type:complete len:154 (-) Transcript_10035:229-690(-)